MKILKTLTSSNYSTVQQVLVKLRTRLPMSTKGRVRFFSFYLDLEMFAKIKKRPGFYSLAFYTFINNSRSKQNKRIPHTLFRHYQQKTCAKFQQKILNFVVVGAPESFQFFRQKACFLGNRRGFSLFRQRILHNLISTTKL